MKTNKNIITLEMADEWNIGSILGSTPSIDGTLDRRLVEACNPMDSSGASSQSFVLSEEKNEWNVSIH